MIVLLHMTILKVVTKTSDQSQLKENHGNPNKHTGCISIESANLIEHAYQVPKTDKPPFFDNLFLLPFFVISLVWDESLSQESLFEEFLSKEELFWDLFAFSLQSISLWPALLHEKHLPLNAFYFPFLTANALIGSLEPLPFSCSSSWRILPLSICNDRFCSFPLLLWELKTMTKTMGFTCNQLNWSYPC